MWCTSSFHMGIHERKNANCMGLSVISHRYGLSAMVGTTNPWLPDDAYDLVTNDAVVDMSGELGLIFHRCDPKERI